MPQPLILPSDLSGGGTLLSRYRELLADELGFLMETTVTAAAVSGEARRVVLADELRDDEVGSSLLPGGGLYLYVRTGDLAGTQRRILTDREAGYQGSRSAVMLSRPLDAPLAVGTVVEITGPLPVKRHLGVKGLNECISEGLARCPVVVRVSLTGNGTNQHSLTDYPWITHEDQILGIYDAYPSGATTDALMPSIYDFRIDSNGATRTLVTERAYATSDTPELAVVVRGDHLVYDGATWTYALEPGLHDENDRGAVPEHWATTFGMSRALRFQYRMVRDDRRIPREEKAGILGDLGAERRKWAMACMAIQDREFPKPPAKRIAGLVSGMGESGLMLESVGGWP